MWEFIPVMIFIFYCWTRTVFVDASHFILVERRWCIYYFNLWKSYYFLTAGPTYMMPLIDSIKKDRQGIPIDFKCKNEIVYLKISTEFENFTKLTFNIKCTYDINDRPLFLDFIHSNTEYPIDIIISKFEEEFKKLIEEQKPKKLTSDTFHTWVNKDHTLMKKFGISINQVDVVDVEISKNTKMIPMDVLEHFINMNGMENGKNKK